MDCITENSLQKSKIGCFASGPSATHDDHPSGGRRELGDPLSYPKLATVARTNIKILDAMMSDGVHVGAAANCEYEDCDV